MKYAQLFITDHRGQVEKLGSDGVVPMDIIPIITAPQLGASEE